MLFWLTKISYPSSKLCQRVFLITQISSWHHLTFHLCISFRTLLKSVIDNRYQCGTILLFICGYHSKLYQRVLLIKRYHHGTILLSGFWISFRTLLKNVVDNTDISMAASYFPVVDIFLKNYKL